MRARPLRSTVLLLFVYTVAALAWLWFGSTLGSRLIIAEEESDAASWTRRIVQIYAQGRDRDFVLNSWRIAVPAVAGALACHAFVVLAGGAWRRRGAADEVQKALNPIELATTAVLIVASFGFLLLTPLVGAIQDYHLYVQIWDEILAGRDPWFLVVGGSIGSYSLNAYGPLYNGLALPRLLNALAPKLIFASAYWLFVFWLVECFARRRGVPSWGRLAMAAWFANPFPWVEIAVYGHFDVLVALLCIAAIETRLQGRWGVSVGWLSAGVLLKFLPAVFAPFLALERGVMRWRYLFATAALSLGGMAIAGLVWGGSVIRPLTLAVNRESAHLSIFRTLRGVYSPIERDTLFFTTDEYATPLLLFALYKTWRWAWRTRFEAPGSCTLAATITLAFYKVGFPQYYMVLFLMAPYGFVREWPRLAFRAWPVTAYAACFAWIAWFDLRMTEGTLGWEIEWVGVPTCLLLLHLAIAIMNSHPRGEPEEASPTS